MFVVFGFCSRRLVTFLCDIRFRYLVVIYTAIMLFLQYGYQFSYIRKLIDTIYPTSNKYVSLEDIGLVDYKSKDFMLQNCVLCVCACIGGFQ